jgi:transposase InsO family protein
MYLSVILDLFNNEVVSYQLSHHAGLELVIKTVEQAVEKRNVRGVLLHSDQGGQYTSAQYIQLLRTYGIVQSMSRKGDCLDNAPME